jgi:hypothetical protein
LSLHVSARSSHHQVPEFWREKKHSFIIGCTAARCKDIIYPGTHLIEVRVGLRADVYVVTKRKFFSCRESNPGSSLVALLSELSLFVAQRKCLPFYPNIPFTDCKQAYHRKRIIVSCCAFKLNLVPLLSTCRERMRLRPYISVIALVTHFMVITIASMDAGVFLRIQVDV